MHPPPGVSVKVREPFAVRQVLGQWKVQARNVLFFSGFIALIEAESFFSSWNPFSVIGDQIYRLFFLMKFPDRSVSGGRGNGVLQKNRVRIRMTQFYHSGPWGSSVSGRSRFSRMFLLTAEAGLKCLVYIQKAGCRCRKFQM